MKAILEITDEQLLDVVAFVKEKGITAVYEGALLLEVGKKYRNRKGEIVTINGEEHGFYRECDDRLYYPNGRFHSSFESELDLIEEVKDELPFEMVVGGVYEMRNGGIEKIIAKYEDHTHPFKGISGRSYKQSGGYLISQKSEFDLIKRIR